MDLKMNAGEPLFELGNEWGDQIRIHSSERTDDEAASLRSMHFLESCAARSSSRTARSA
jgi:hypothetical protein